VGIGTLIANSPVIITFSKTLLITRRQTPSENGKVNMMSSHDMMVSMIPQQLLLSARSTGPAANTSSQQPTDNNAANPLNCIKILNNSAGSFTEKKRKKM